MGGAYLILVLTLVTTFYAWHLVEQPVVEQDTERFKDEVRRMIEMLRANHRRHLDTLNPLRARLESAPEITTALWRQAVTREPWHAAGSLEVGYAEAQGDGPDLKCPVRFLETKLEGSRRQPGTDLAQETAIRPALRAAAANDHAVATRRVRLTTAGAPDRRLAVLVLLAVRAPEPASTARGFLFLTYDPEELVNDPRLQMASSGVELAIVAPLTPKPGAIAEPEEPFQRRTLFTMPGVSWTLLFTARPSFFLASEKMLPRLVLGTGIILSLLLFRIAWGETHRRLAAERAARLRTEMVEREHAARELEEALASERELGRLKSNFVATVSHEFRTPLAVILSSSELLERYYDGLDPGQRREQLQTISHAVRRMSALMEQVLLLSRVDAGNLEFKRASLDLAALVRRVAADVATATQSRCPIHVRAAELPPVLADQGLLQIVLTNLINNAVKYSPAGSSVSVSLERANTDAVLQVRDAGIGIPAEDQKRLFTPFFRAGNAGDIPGTGLGLAIVKRCVALHEGALTCESTAGHGATFTVRLPVFPPLSDHEKNPAH